MAALSKAQLVQLLEKQLEEMKIPGLTQYEKKRAVDRLANTLLERGLNNADYLNENKQILKLGIQVELKKGRDSNFKFDFTRLLPALSLALRNSPAEKLKLKEAMTELVVLLKKNGIDIGKPGESLGQTVDRLMQQPDGGIKELLESVQKIMEELSGLFAKQKIAAVTLAEQVQQTNTNLYGFDPSGNDTGTSAQAPQQTDAAGIALTNINVGEQNELTEVAEKAEGLDVETPAKLKEHQQHDEKNAELEAEDEEEYISAATKKLRAGPRPPGGLA